MPRQKACGCLCPRWSSTVTQALVLSIITFSVVLPHCCQRLLYSYFFDRSKYLDSMSEDALQQSLSRGQDALRFWQSASTRASSVEFTDITQNPELLVTVVTTRRSEATDYHYLLQVMQQLSLLLGSCGEKRRCAEVLVCDVESGPLENEDAKLLEGHFRVIRRSHDEKLKNTETVNTFEREKRDYVFCLRKGWQLVTPKNVLVLEDDAVPRHGFFAVVNDLLSRQFARHTLYIKLFHPERLQRYWNPEPYRILEWVGLGLLGGMTLLLVCTYLIPCSFSFTLSGRHLIFFTLYVMAVAELVGRHYLLEIRRLSPQFYAVSPATECCTQAMLFPGNTSVRAAQYLDGSFCSPGNAKDIVLYHIARTTPGEQSHSVEPNLLIHIGAYSSVRPNPNRPSLL